MVGRERPTGGATAGRDQSNTVESGEYLVSPLVRSGLRMSKVITVLYWIYAAVLVLLIIGGLLSVFGVFSTGYDGPGI
jgi:hypothetical protein